MPPEHQSEIVQRLSDQDDVVAVFCAFPVIASAFLDNDAVYQGELICIDDGSTNCLRAGFIRQIPLKGRPNTLLQTLVDHAACATAVAEAAMLDPADRRPSKASEANGADAEPADQF